MRGRPVGRTPAGAQRVTATADLGATLRGVKALVPFLPVDGASKPSAVDVETFLEARSAQVLVAAAGRLRALDALAVGDAGLTDDLVRCRLWAASLACTGAAGDAVAAAYPEGADVEQTDTTYDGALHKEFRDGLAALVAALDGLLDDRSASTAADQDPAVCSPCPVFTTRTVW